MQVHRNLAGRSGLRLVRDLGESSMFDDSQIKEPDRVHCRKAILFVECNLQPHEFFQTVFNSSSSHDSLKVDINVSRVNENPVLQSFEAESIPQAG